MNNNNNAENETTTYITERTSFSRLKRAFLQIRYFSNADSDVHFVKLSICFCPLYLIEKHSLTRPTIEWDA